METISLSDCDTDCVEGTARRENLNNRIKTRAVATCYITLRSGICWIDNYLITIDNYVFKSFRMIKVFDVCISIRIIRDNTSLAQ